jgi:hypothetical protein
MKNFTKLIILILAISKPLIAADFCYDKSNLPSYLKEIETNLVNKFLPSETYGHNSKIYFQEFFYREVNLPGAYDNSINSELLDKINSISE